VQKYCCYFFLSLPFALSQGKNKRGKEHSGEKIAAVHCVLTAINFFGRFNIFRKNICSSSSSDIRQDETQFTTKIDGFSEFYPPRPPFEC
jgi:hypothetical protein